MSNVWIYPNNWIPTKSLEQMANIHYDVLIVGSGAGGGAALYRLCEQWKKRGAKKIGILEKGDKLFLSHALNIPTMNNSRMWSQLLPDNSTPVGKHLPEFSGARLVFALGGRTLFWNAASPRPPIFELQKWPVNPWEMNVYFRLAEKVMNVTTSYAKGSMQNILWRRLVFNGVPEATDYPVAIDISGSQSGEIHSNAWFSSINFLAYALNNRPFDLALNAYTTQVFVDKGKVKGVNVITPDNKNYSIRSKNVLISASTLETPRLLLNSCIKGQSIGRYLTNHSFLGGHGKISRSHFSSDVGNLAILKQETAIPPYQIQILGPDVFDVYQQFEEKQLPEDLGVTFATFGRVESRPDNRVFLDPSVRDEYGVPMNQVNFSYSEKDNEVIFQMRQGIIYTARTMGITLDGEPDFLPPGADFHESCTCRMGIDPETSATNRFGQIHGIQGLYIADNSVLPTLSAANPTLSTVALAIKTADHIVKKSE
ncbi:MAG: GMC oxidoreductase [Bacillota bacterium]